MKSFKDRLKAVKKEVRPSQAAPSLPSAPPEPSFRELCRDVKPLKDDRRYHPPPQRLSARPRSGPSQNAPDAAQLQELLRQMGGWFEPAEAELDFTRPGMPSATLKKLRSGNWPVVAQLDLHNHDRYQAQDALALFLHRAQQRAFACA